MGGALDKAALVAIFIESILWGFLALMFPLVMFLLLRNGSGNLKHIPQTLMVIIMFILCTAHIVMSYLRTTQAFTGESKLDPTRYLANITDNLYRGKYGMLFIAIFLGDLVIVSRCLALWNKNYFVVLAPTALAVATLVCAAGTLNSLAIVAHTNITSSHHVHTWMVATYSLALATKLVCLGLILFRIHQIHATLTSNVNRHVKIFTTLVALNESGAVALLFTLFLLPTAALDISEHVIFCDALSPIMGITVLGIIAGMSIDFSNARATHSVSHPVFRHSVNRPTAVQRAASRRWNDFDHDFEDAKAIESPKSPTSSSNNLTDEAFKSSGTLNTSVVI